MSYTKSLVNTLVTQSHNKLFYQGNTSEGAKVLTKEVVNSVHANRCSIWMYNHDKTSIICKQLYIKEEDAWYQGLELFKKDYEPYFDALEENPIIIADDAETNLATACFAETYLTPLNIKSMLDVPIMYIGNVIGVVCVESITPHKWSQIEVDFARMISAIFAFSYSVAETIQYTIEINKKNTYLEHAAKILRHDMHSGINTYIPRGISSLERRLNPEIIEQFKLEAPLKMLKEGLAHTQKVYKGVYEFTNLVKHDVVMDKTLCDLKQILETYLGSTAYKSQVKIESLPTVEVNESLFCTAIDNLIRNGLKYNDNNTKFVHLYMDGTDLIIQDNGRGMSQKDFEEWSKPYTRKENQKESGSGLGLNICVAILKEHKFTTSCEKNNIGTRFKIKVIND